MNLWFGWIFLKKSRQPLWLSWWASRCLSRGWGATGVCYQPLFSRNFSWKRQNPEAFYPTSVSLVRVWSSPPRWCFRVQGKGYVAEPYFSLQLTSGTRDRAEKEREGAPGLPVCCQLTQTMAGWKITFLSFWQAKLPSRTLVGARVDWDPYCQPWLKCIKSKFCPRALCILGSFGLCMDYMII